MPGRDCELSNAYTPIAFRGLSCSSATKPQSPIKLLGAPAHREGRIDAGAAAGTEGPAAALNA